MLLLCGKGKPGASMEQREEGIGGEDSSFWGYLASPEKQGPLLLYASSPAKKMKGTGMTKRYLSLLGGTTACKPLPIYLLRPLPDLRF